MDAKYSEESVQELLDWVKERLEKKDFPSEIVLNRSTKIPDCGKFFLAVFTTLSANKKNPFFHPLMDELRLVRERLDTPVP